LPKTKADLTEFNEGEDALLQQLLRYFHPQYDIRSNKMNFDEQRIYYSYQNLQQQPRDSEEAADEEVFLKEPTNLLDGNYADLQAVKRHCREFLSKCNSCCKLQNFSVLNMPKLDKFSTRIDYQADSTSYLHSP
jgi:hypothetical protein